MRRVYIYGRGKGCSILEGCLSPNVKILAYIDNFSNENYTHDGIPIIKQDEIVEGYDYIIVSIMGFAEIKSSLLEKGISGNNIICFFDIKDADNQIYYSVIDKYKWRNELLWKYTRDCVIPAIDNLPYEIYTDELRTAGFVPRIAPGDIAIKEIVCNRKSLARFGDGEFEIMLKRNRARFQSSTNGLTEKLREIIQSDDDRVLIAVADNYGRLDKYTDEAAAAIRAYMTLNVRKEHMALLSSERDYYDAYLSRPYIIYRDKDRRTMSAKFDLLKKIWQSQSVLIVEGEHTRFGVGNDLLFGVTDIKRIIVPDKNAYNHYQEILNAVEQYGQDRLVLAVIGPTATALAYDLTKKGLWVVDIGQVDTEYEWYLRGTEQRCNIPYKTVSEYADKNVFEEIPGEFKLEYEKEIILEII
ncbi:MAG: GT-D fold domain-containing protein [Eubacterium sp.]|nr:GT-D fold domain-containing protein [Eubacterium sp.]